MVLLGTGPYVFGARAAVGIDVYLRPGRIPHRAAEEGRSEIGSRRAE